MDCVCVHANETVILFEIIHFHIFCASNQEVIAGKCNVLCISNDSRNPQPSDEALKRADFVFCRTFDVGKREVCNEICDKIAGVEGLSSVFQKRKKFSVV